MENSKRFKPIVNLAHDSEHQAARILGVTLKKLNESKAQLEQLTSYLQEYTQRLQQEGSHGMSGQQLNEYRGFMAKIDAAIISQKKTVQNLQVILDEKKKIWFSKRGRSKALDTILDSYLEKEQVKIDKRDQREQDDRARCDLNNDENE